MTIAGIAANVQELLVGMGEFVSVLGYPQDQAINFNGYPAVAHYYLNTQSDFATVSQNRRVIEYIVEVWLANQDTPEAQVNQMNELIDSVLNVFDKSIDLSSSDLGLAAACDIMRPTPGALERVEVPDGLGWVSTIHLFCEADISFR